MYKMSEDKAINKATKFVQEYREKEQKFYDYLFSMKENDIPIQAIETILDLYQHKKGRIDELKQELLQEKEKNEELDEKLKMSIAMLTKGTYPETEKGANDFDNYFISKDKIRDMQRYREFELQQEYKEFEDDIEWQTYNKILEEE